MSLGLDELTDDQLMELLNEACIELAVRDPIVRKLAQGCIRDTAVLLPEIRRAIKEIVDDANEEDLEAESEPSRAWSRRRRRRNPTPQPPPPQHAYATTSFTSSAFMPGSFTVPQSPTRVNNHKTVSIIAPVGYQDIQVTIADRLRRQLGRGVIVYSSNSPNILHVHLSDAEIQLIKQSPLFAQFSIVIIP